jgi:hypothetical protein
MGINSLVCLVTTNHDQISYTVNSKSACPFEAKVGICYKLIYIYVHSQPLNATTLTHNRYNFSSS